MGRYLAGEKFRSQSASGSEAASAERRVEITIATAAARIPERPITARVVNIICTRITRVDDKCNRERLNPFLYSRLFSYRTSERLIQCFQLCDETSSRFRIA